MRFAVLVFIFLVINFAALAIGGVFTGGGVRSFWYQNLNQAPWTPPGWVFGFAWTTIMVCFSFYMAKLIKDSKPRRWGIVLFVFQWILNVIWNPIFFYFQETALGLVVITLLTSLIAFILFNRVAVMKRWSLLLLPYFLWLCIATSLNLYILVYN